MLNRRQFLATCASTLAVSAMPGSLFAATAPASSPLFFYSGSANTQGEFFLSGTDMTGKPLFDIPMPGRGHAPVIRPDGKLLVMVARRPDNWLLVANLDNGDVQTLSGQDDRHYHGHGVFSADGSLFYATENDFDNQRGVIGVYQVNRQFKKVGEFPSGGIGPHELLLAPDNQHLIVANGGILTHPDTGRAKLNLDSMQPNLAIIDRLSGELKVSHQLDSKYHQLSIRHIDVSQDFTVGIALQYQGSPADRFPLIGLWRPGQQIELLQAPEAALDRMRNYCGSVTMDSSGEIMAVSSPRGGLISYWSTRNGKWLGHSDLKDGCGIAATGQKGQFLISSGNGALLLHTPAAADIGLAEHTETLASFPLRWDNHLISA